MHLLLRTTLLLRLGDVMRVDARERHSEYSRVIHGLVAPQSLALSFKRKPEPTLVSTASIRMGVPGKCLARRRFGRVHFAGSFKCARDLDTEVAQYRRARLSRVVVEKNVVAISPQPRLAANELPDLAQGRPPRRANRARRDLAPHRGQLAGVNSL